MVGCRGKSTLISSVKKVIFGGRVNERRKASFIVR
jgi:hypothetical protein